MVRHSRRFPFCVCRIIYITPRECLFYMKVVGMDELRMILEQSGRTFLYVNGGNLCMVVKW